MGKKKDVVEDLPEHLRCGRRDGRSWRCRRKVLDGMKLCEIHYIQGRHRQIKVQVPEELKIQRNNTNVVKNSGSVPNKAEIRARKVRKMAKMMKRKKRSSAGELEAIDEALRKKQSKKSDMQLDLIRMVLKREVEKCKKKKPGSELKGKKSSMRKMKKLKDKKELTVDEEHIKKELTRELPNGFMEISSVPSARDSGNVGSRCDVKVGFNLETANPRRFRSKNIEKLPVATVKVLPFANLKKCSRNKCHWCQRSGPLNLIKCLSCKKELFCMDCIKERYFDTQNEVKKACPVCRGICACNECLATQSKGSESKELPTGKSRDDRILQVHYLIYMLLPVVRQVNEERNAELETEAIMRGEARHSDFQVKETEFGSTEACCNNCNFPIVDIHRSCPKCSYNLCISCCGNFRQGSVPMENGSGITRSTKRRKAYTENEMHVSDELDGAKKLHVCCKQLVASPSSACKSEESCGVISCPPTELGGCGTSHLDLQCVFPFDWIKGLEVSAEEIVCSYEFPETLDTASSCSLCVRTDHDYDGSLLLQAAERENSNDNYLFHPMPLYIDSDKFEHFQKHWGKGHPVIVRNVLQTTSSLSWDPLVMFCGYLEKSIARYENNRDLLKACLDWCEVEINIRQYFCGSLRNHTQRNTWNEMLVLKGWLSSDIFKEQFPAHFADIMNSLPLQEYINPVSGLLNIAANLPPDIPKPEQGPSVYISYTCADDVVQADYVTKLSCASYDVVNILAHSTDAPNSTEECTKIRKLLKRYNGICQTEPAEMHTEQTKRKSPLDANIAEEEEEEEALQDVNETESTSTPSLLDSNADRKCDSDLDSDFDSEPRPLAICYFPSTANSADECCGNQTHDSNDDRKQKLGGYSVAQWDIFRRQDVPKLVEYLERHSNEFLGMRNHRQQPIIHPILDEIFFLDATHKIKLKDEFEIEPWTFEQHVGEAVIIPAGCPYQIRNPKGCVHVVLDFVSPENVTECIQLIDEIRLLPGNHKAKFDTRQVKRMALHCISEAIKEIHELR